LRSTVWPILAGVHSHNSKAQNKMETLSKGKTYEEHLACASDPKNFSDMSRPGGTIDRDLRRTFPTVRFFVSKPASLFNSSHSLTLRHTHTHTHLQGYSTYSILKG